MTARTHATRTRLPGPARALLDRARAEWRRAWILRVLLTGVAVALGAATCLVLLDQALSFPEPARAVLRWLPPLALLAVLGRGLGRLLPAPGEERLALLVEERRPELAFHLATLIGASPTTTVGRVFSERAAREAARVRGPVVPAAPGREVLAVAAASAVLATLALLLVPGGGGEVLARWVRLSGGPATGLAAAGRPPVGRTAEASATVFRDVRVRVEPPGYTGSGAFETASGEPVRALAGSRVQVAGVAPRGATSVRFRLLGSEGRASEVPAGSFAVGWQVGARDRGVELAATRDGSVLARHVLALVVEPDRPPVVELREPDRDLVLAAPRGTLPVRATATDDHGVADFRLTWILSRGGGESFSFTDGGTDWDSVRDEAGTLTGLHALDLEALGARPGDVIHLRAVARDANAVTGPGEGVSPTRVVRIARDDEMDRVNTLIAFPLEVEGDPVLSQRMVILMTERLIERAPGLPPAEVRAESQAIAREQARLRERLADVIWARSSGAADAGHGAEPHGHDAPVPGPAAPDAPLDSAALARRVAEVLDAASRATGLGLPEEFAHDHDPDPALAVNAALVPAFNAMYDAERHLALGEPAEALPHEYRALEIVQGVREAERVFVRGAQTVAPIDVAAARGTGRVEDAAPSARSAGRPEPSPLRHLSALERLATEVREATGPGAAREVAAVAAALLEDAAVDPAAGALVARAAEAAAAGRTEDAAERISEARAFLLPPSGAGHRPAAGAPLSAAGAAFLARRAPAGGHGPAEAGRAEPTADPPPFVFATARYASGNWDSAPLVPANLIHSLALYTALPVSPEGVVVDLDSPELFRFPFVFMTGHLPVRFTEGEARNVREYVDRGGFLFIDDHNHDIDGAFHRTVTAELARIFGEGALVELPNDHELYDAFFVFEDGPPTTSHELNGWGDGLVHEHLHAIERNGRVAVLYSNKDYASEWSYHAVNKRFLAVDNTRFGVNVLVYALTR